MSDVEAESSGFCCLVLPIRKMISCLSSTLLRFLMTSNWEVSVQFSVSGLLPRVKLSKVLK